MVDKWGVVYLRFSEGEDGDGYSVYMCGLGWVWCGCRSCVFVLLWGNFYIIYVMLIDIWFCDVVSWDGCYGSI